MEKLESSLAKLATASSTGSLLSLIEAWSQPTTELKGRFRGHIVQREIVGTLRNSKGTSIHERIMTVLATLPQQRLNTLQMMRMKLSS